MKKTLSALAAITLIVIALGACAAQADEKPVAAAADPTTTTTTTTEPEAHIPVPADFQLDLVTVSKQCFGSAGCNVDYEIDLTYLPAMPLDDDAAYSLIYEVSGGEDGVVINTIEVIGDQYTQPSYQSVSTSSDAAVLTAAVTAVRPS